MSELGLLEDVVGASFEGLLLAANASRKEPVGPNGFAGLAFSGEHDVFEHGHGAERLWDLECADESDLKHAVRRQTGYDLSVEADLAGVWLEEACDAVEGGGFAGAVRSDHAGDDA